MSGHAAERPVVVMKFGGTSVGSIERIEHVARRIKRHLDSAGERVVVVVSAMSGETDRLVELSRKISGNTVAGREYHQLLASGEQVSSALTAMALERLGVAAHSLLAHQVRLRTREIYGQNLIDEIDTTPLDTLLSVGITPVVAGFQGVGERGSITTLGRGGSDTTAVALAAALGSCRCYIYTDVEGVYTALTSICRGARKLPSLTYEEMMELASGGAKVLHSRCVSLAYRYKVPLLVRSTFSEDPGTEIVEEYEGMENTVVSGITVKSDEAKVTLRAVPDRPGNAAKIFRRIAEAGIVVDMIVQSEGLGGKAEISFTVPEASAKATYEVMLALAKEEMPDTSIDVDTDIAKLSVVGEGMRHHAGIAAEMFDILGREGINIEMITTSEIKISVAIKAKYSELAVRVLHDRFLENGRFREVSKTAEKEN